MNNYSLWVMEFANVPNYPLSGLVYGAHNQGTRRLPYCYILIKGQGKVAMVDVGYNHKAYGEVLATMFGGRDWHPPDVVLAECGVSPQDVTDVFLTHSHFDHMGNIEDFPNATFYIQERELSKWVWTLSLERRFRWLMLGIDAQPDAAWNPIAGFTDGFGQLLWSALGDPALFSAPYGSGWMLNRIADVQSKSGR